jgi:HYR domain/Abnormal spindle-like microcephaly-assoc'd, ASPM-SPD-2-Hydin/HYDIN/CFA65/VesB-like, Ig-like domain
MQRGRRRADRPSRGRRSALTWIVAALALAVVAALPLATASAGTKTAKLLRHHGLINAPGRAHPHLMLTPHGQRTLARHYPRHFMDGTTDMTYHGGSVMRNVTTYAIFWSPTTLPAGYTGAPFDSNYRSLVDRYFNDIGTTPYFNILTQFGDNSGNPVANTTTFGGDWVDTTTFPHAGTNADPLQDGDIRASVDRAIAANPTWQAPSNSTMYFVYTPKSIIECSGGDCFAANDYLGNSGSHGKFCAYHWNNGNKIYAFIPYAATGSCFSDDTAWPNGNGDGTTNNPGVDVSLDVTSHEQFEAYTDPFGDAWYDDVDGHAGENGDKCNFNYGPYEPDGTNIVLHGHTYQLQREWSNGSPHGCVKRFGARPQTTITGDLDFGTVPRGSSAVRDITLQNTGNGDLDILNARLAGSSDVSYSLTPASPTSSTLAPGHSALYHVKFAPSATATFAGLRTGSLIIDTDDTVPNDTGAPSNDQLTATNTIPISGTAGMPEIAVSGSLDFGTVPRGTSQTRAVTIQNTGNAPLTINSVSMLGGSDPAFSVLSGPGTPRTIQPSDSIVYTVRFAPPASSNGAVRTGTLRILSDDPVHPSVDVAASGTPGIPHGILSSSSFDFGGVPVDNRTTPHQASQPLTITNQSSCALCDLTITSLTITGPQASDFTLVGAPVTPFVIGAGNHVDLVVRFNPSAGGTRNATLTVNSDDPSNPSIAVALTGEGLLPAIASAPGTPTSPLIFGPTVYDPNCGIFCGQTQTETFTNTGQAELIADLVAFTGDPAFSGPGASSPPDRFAPGTSLSEPVTFHPTAPARKVTGTLTLTDAFPLDPAQAPVTRSVPLCGEAVGRGIRVLVEDNAGNPITTPVSIQLRSVGTSPNVIVNANSLALQTISPPTSCQTIRFHYENQKLPATEEGHASSSYYTIVATVGGTRKAAVTFTLAPNEFRQIVMVVDTDPPTIFAPSVVNAKTTSTRGRHVSFRVRAIDQRDGRVGVRCAPISGSFFRIGSTRVTCSAHDRSGNRAVRRFRVVVRHVRK